uniref:Uncharacterized protein n=1 Tax=Nelumbo nucifera TaxID=4432 RepID=A0A822ZLJ6_NELNU|nr:TPA_asm: hypothetical protein HUJ06_016871 [Nelumbo nucifera]
MVGVLGDVNDQFGDTNAGPEVNDSVESEVPIGEFCVSGGLEHQSGDGDMDLEIVFPPNVLTYEEELVQIQWELMEYCDNHDVPSLHFPVVDPVSV